MAKKKPKKSRKKRAATQKKTAAKGKAARNRTRGARAVRPSRKKGRQKKKRAEGMTFPVPPPATSSGRQSGDLQGLSTGGRADSESVEELVGEGNAFEADVVAGVEYADDSDEKEVHTHEVPEDDVPGEYLDED